MPDTDPEPELVQLTVTRDDLELLLFRLEVAVKPGPRGAELARRLREQTRR